MAKDAAEILEYKNVASSMTIILGPLGEDEKQRAPKSFSLARQPLLISESGLYKLIMRAHRSNPAAAAFQDWVTKVVLPAIRKDGGYVIGEEKVATGEMSEDELVLKAITVLHRKVERLGCIAGAERPSGSHGIPNASAGLGLSRGQGLSLPVLAVCRGELRRMVCTTITLAAWGTCWVQQSA